METTPCVWRWLKALLDKRLFIFLDLDKLKALFLYL